MKDDKTIEQFGAELLENIWMTSVSLPYMVFTDRFGLCQFSRDVDQGWDVDFQFYLSMMDLYDESQLFVVKLLDDKRGFFLVVKTSVQRIAIIPRRGNTRQQVDEIFGEIMFSGSDYIVFGSSGKWALYFNYIDEIRVIGLQEQRAIEGFVDVVDFFEDFESCACREFLEILFLNYNPRSKKPLDHIPLDELARFRDFGLSIPTSN